MQRSKQAQTTQFELPNAEANMSRSLHQKPESQQKAKKRNYWSSKTKHRNFVYIPQTQRRIWKETASSLTRQISPSHRIPKGRRFSSVEEDIAKNRIFLTLQLRRQFADNRISGIAFPKSKRKNHFINKSNLETPSAATYQKTRFLDNSFYKTKRQKCQDLRLDIQKVVNPEFSEDQKKIQYHYLNHNFNHNRHFSQQKNLNGRTFASFNNYSKMYLDHAKNMPYQPQLFIGIPGVGSYEIDKSSKKQATQIKYSMKKTLQKFNQNHDQHIPGPGKYLSHKGIQKQHSFCVRGTFPQSNRIYLQSPDNGNPGSPTYKIRRWLDKQ